MTLESFLGSLDPLVLVIVALAGIVRGVTGFGGAMFMAPPLSLLVSPVLAVIYALALEAVAAVVALPSVWRLLERRTLGLIGIPALFSIQVGGLLLVSLDAGLIRNLLAVTVMMFSVLLLFGFRYTEPPRRGPAAVVGGISGLLFGATSMGGPPVILYLLSGPSRHDVTRANLMAYISMASALALIVPWQTGQLTGSVALNAVTLTLPYLLGIGIGAKLFALVDERTFRRLTLAFMFSVSTFALLA